MRNGISIKFDVVNVLKKTMCLVNLKAVILQCVLVPEVLEWFNFVHPLCFHCYDLYSSLNIVVLVGCYHGSMLREVEFF